MRKSIKLLFIMSLIASFSIPTAVWANATEGNDNENETSISSPDEKVELNFHLTKDGKPQYQLSFDDTQLLEPSSLGGFEFKEQAPLDSNFEVIDTSHESFDEDWEPEWGDKEEIQNNYEKLTVSLQEEDTPHRKMNIEFKVYDDGIGFRYVLPEQENLDEDLDITSEDTEFSFSDDNTSWWIPRDWDDYELQYNETPLSEVEDVHTPFSMKTPEGIHMAVHEAALVDYSSMALKSVEDEENTLESHLAPWPDSDIKVKKDELPIETPWRTIQVGEDAGDLFESDLILNLNEPSEIEDTSWIEPTKFVGIWWEMISGKSTWESGPDHGATTENAKEYIDFAHEHLDTDNQNIGFLVEGWNNGWDGDWMENGDLFNFTEPYPDYNLEEVVDYADEHDVEYIIHNETSGDILNYEEQMDDAYDLYQNLGIHSIKSGYVADDGIKNPEGQHHHGQYMVNHYLKSVKEAADHEIMVDTHEPIKGTGLERTYPNWVSREGVSGMEYKDANSPEHDTIIPFTRGLAGPMDFTPGIFDVEVSHNPDTHINSTRAKQLALYVTISSGAQMVADLPENYKDEDGDILPEFQFIKDVPVDWDETIVPDSEIGDYATMARRSGEEWYIGSITDENERDLDTELDFLDSEEKYVAEIYSDGPEADLEDNPNSVSIDKVIIDSNDTLKTSMATGGGQAVKLSPATEADINEIPAYEEPEVNISSTEIPDTIQSNDDLKVTVNVENTGDITAGKSLKLQIDGETVEQDRVRLGPNDTEEITLSYDHFFEEGDHQVNINDLDSETVTVEEKENDVEYNDLEVSADQTITATVTVTNYGSSEESVEVPFYIDREEVERKDVVVPAEAGGGEKEVTFTYEPKDEADIYEVTIGVLEPQIIAFPDIDLEGKWLFKEGDNSNWKDPDMNDDDWEEVTIPNTWEDHSGITDDNVYGWYRKTINVPEEWEGNDFNLALGKIDDVDATYFNGEKIGQMGEFPPDGEWGEMETAWDKVREYNVPHDAIKYGQENVISVRVFDGDYDAGMVEGPYSIDIDVPTISASFITDFVNRFEDAGAFEDNDVFHSLELHLTAVEHFEKQEKSKKIVKHMEGFKDLLSYQKENELISAEAYDTLINYSDELIEEWE